MESQIVPIDLEIMIFVAECVTVGAILVLPNGHTNVEKCYLDLTFFVIPLEKLSFCRVHYFIYTNYDLP